MAPGPQKGFKSQKTLQKEKNQAAAQARWKPLNQEKELTRLKGIVNAADDNLKNQVDKARIEARAESAVELERVKQEATKQREASEKKISVLKVTLSDLLEAHNKSGILLQQFEDLQEDLLDAELQIEELKLAQQKKSTQIEDLTVAIETVMNQAHILLATLTAEEAGESSRKRTSAFSKLDETTKSVLCKRSRALKGLENARAARESGLLKKLNNSEIKVQLLEKEKLVKQLNSSHALFDIEQLTQAKQEAEV
jgi:hypothetical protein